MNIEGKLKVGQEVAIREGVSYHQPFYFTIVKKITDTQVSMTNGDRFMLRSGEKIGKFSRWDYTTVATDIHTGNLVSVEEAKSKNEDWNRMNRKKVLSNKLDKVDLNKLTDEDFEIVKSVLEKYV